MRAAAPRELPGWLAGLFSSIPAEAPPQNLKEYDPEWARAFWTGTAAASCDHARMLASVKVPVLLTHHFRVVDETTGTLMGALSDLQASRARALIEGAGQTVAYRSFPNIGHAMHQQDPKLFAATLVEWTEKLA
jgi:pimeloyl-ACP methyl ester carboxylesterase